MSDLSLAQSTIEFPESTNPVSIVTHREIRPIEYFAGIVDGEGSIFVRYHIEKRTGKKYYTPTIVVAMANLPILRALANRFGGNVNICASPLPGHKQKWDWRTESRKNVERIVSAVHPWLIEKRAQATTMLKYLDDIERFGSKSVNHEAVYWELKRLKQQEAA